MRRADLRNSTFPRSFYVGVAIGGIITDIGLMIVPLPYIFTLRVPLYHKILIAIMLVFGSFACFVTIIRLTKVITVDLSDPTWGTVDLMIWTGMEVYSAVICCCLPTMRPLIKFVWKKCGLKSLSSSGGTDNSKPVSGTGGMWGKKSRQNSRHLQDTILGNGNADEMELTKHAYYELRSNNVAPSIRINKSEDASDTRRGVYQEAWYWTTGL
ncbi:hypothetical protein N0V84_004870 [Fusarium piperis]|uniref:Rhodopsin domain-containing protein n=1 Tax=Fusarium piperis TaxID=1435070 RepID=A0A9W9BPI3_9HYPO|nr:hypothetical protein N0V84_004870 [Fusarium piperis]